MSQVEMVGIRRPGQRENALGIAFLILTIPALILRIFVSPGLLNQFVDYTNDGGSFLVKFHLAAYLIVFVLFLTLFTRPFILQKTDLAMFRMFVRIAAMLIGVTCFIVVVSGVGATGFIIDTYLVAILAGLLLLAQPPEARRIAGDAIIIVMILSAVIAIGEVVGQTRLLPFVEDEPFFRPTGLSGHPLSLGAHLALTIGFVSLTRWPLWLKVLATLVLFVGLAASGARLALIAGAVQILLLLFFSRWHRLSRRHEKQAKFFIIAFVLVIGTLLIAGLYSGGFLSRFNNTLLDENSMARVRIYEIFNYVSWRDILLGMDANTLLFLVRKNLQLYYIESAPVFIIMTLGLPAAIVFMLTIIVFFIRLLAFAPVQARIATLVLIVIDLSNNGFATKNPDIVLLTALVVAYLHPAFKETQQSDDHSPQVLSTTSSRPERFRV